MNTPRILSRSCAALIAVAAFPAQAAQQTITAAGDPAVNASDAAVRWATPANWSGPNGAAIPTATDNAVITYGTTVAAGIDIRASGFTPTGATTIEDLSFAGAGTGAVTLENNSTGTSMVLTLNGGRGAGVPLIQSGAYAVTIPGVGPGTTQTLSLQLAASGDINVGAGGLNFGALISQTGGARSINKTGAGRLTLGNANTFAGGATVSAGILEVASNNALGTGAAVVNGGTLEINLASAVLSASSITVNSGGQIATRGAATLANPFTLAGGTLTTRTTDGGIFAGSINVSAPSFANLRSYTSPANDLSITISGQLFGTGSITINGNATNAGNGRALIVTNTGNTFFSGGFNIDAGQTLRNAPATSGKTIGSGAINLNGGTLQLRDNGAGGADTLAYDNNVTVQASSIIDVDHVGANLANSFQLGTLAIGAQTLTTSGANSYAVRFAGATTLSGAATFNTTTAPLALGGVVSGAFDLTKTGNGILQLNAANTYSGQTRVNGGTLVLLGSVAGSPHIDIASGATLDVTAAGGFTLAGTQTISGAGSVTGTATIGNGGTLQPGDASGAGTLTFAAMNLGSAPGHTSAVNITNAVTPAKINVTGTDGLIANGGASSVTINLPATALPLGTYTLIDYAGTLGGGGFAAFKIGTTPNRILGGLVNNTANTSIDYNITAIDFPIWKGAQSSEWSTSALAPAKNWVLNSNNAAGTDFLTLDNVTFNDIAASTNVDVSVADVAVAAINFSNATKDYTVAGSRAITGAATLTKTGAAAVTIGNANSFTGGVNFNEGTVIVPAVANAGVNSPLGAGGPMTFNGGTLESTGTTQSTDRAITLNANGGTVKTNASLTLAGVVGGAGALTKTGSGTLILNNTNGYGDTTISAGTLQIGAGGAAGTTGAGNITNNAALTFNRSDAALVVSNPIGGTGTVSNTGAGTVTLGGAGSNTYLGVTTVASGTLLAGKTGGATAIPGDLVIANGATFRLLASDQIANASTVTINGGAFGDVPNIAGPVSAGPIDTVASVNVNGGTFLSGRNLAGFNVSNLLHVTAGLALVQRGGVLSANAVQLSGGSINLDGGSGTTANESHLSIGAGGLTISGATINFNAGPSPVAAGSVGSILTLTGDLISSGAVNFLNLAPAVATTAKAVLDLGGSSRGFAINGGTTTIAAAIQNGGIVKTGAGTLTLTGAQSYSTLHNVAGVTNVKANANNASITDDAVLNFTVSQTLASLTITAGGVVTLDASGPEFAPSIGGSDFPGADSLSTGAVQAVPEPGIAGLLLLGALGLLARRR